MLIQTHLICVNHIAHCTLTFNNPPKKCFRSSLDPAEVREEPGCCKKAYNWFCGFDQGNAPKLTKEQEAAMKLKLTDTTEKPLWRNVVNANAIILLAVCVFFYGFFA